MCVWVQNRQHSHKKSRKDLNEVKARFKIKSSESGCLGNTDDTYCHLIGGPGIPSIVLVDLVCFKLNYVNVRMELP